MGYTLINLITFGVGTIFLYNGYRIVRSGREDLIVFVMSGIIGMGLLFVAIFPNVFEIIASVLGIEKITNAILIVSNMTLFLLVIYLFNRIGSLHYSVSRLNEELTLLRAGIEESDDD
jgi:hypothetical protein